MKRHAEIGIGCVLLISALCYTCGKHAFGEEPNDVHPKSSRKKFTETTTATASFHLMQIEQVIGGVNGDTTAQVIQLRMRAGGQNLLAPSALRVWDEFGKNPITLYDFVDSVQVASAGSRVLIISDSVFDRTEPSVSPDYVMKEMIPPSYLAGGSLTFETDNGSVVYWRLSWGTYSGPTDGSTVNDDDGDFGPGYPGPLPFSGFQALRFVGTASDFSSSNAVDYELIEGPIDLVNNDGFVSTLAFTGACCDDANGVCVETIAKPCLEGGFRYGGDGTTCDAIDPPCMSQPCDIGDECNDNDVCTIDTCSAQGCAFTAGKYGDVASAQGECGQDGLVSIFDIIAMLDVISVGVVHPPCGLSTFDLTGANGPCVGDGKVDLFDVLAILNAFVFATNCCAPPSQCSTAVECDDGQFCNGVEICDGALCRPGPINCPGRRCNELNNSCFVGLPAKISCVPRLTHPAPGQSVGVDVFIEETVDLRGYQTAVDVTMNQGVGGLECIDSFVDIFRADYVFAGEGSASIAGCDPPLAAAAIDVGTGAVFSEPKYLATFTFETSDDTPLGSSFEIDVLPEDDSFLSDSQLRPIPFLTAACTVTMQDCQGNGITDACDIECGDDGGPCDVTGCGGSNDCNGNDIPDECDIADGTSSDCGNNGVPDECEPDCNGNGEPDDCDLLNGISGDCNNNGVPDECEDDCDGNRIADECDFATCDGDPGCEDCNGNQVLDRCDIAACDGSVDSADCDDCNLNLSPDLCDIAQGLSIDADGDGIPDECVTWLGGVDDNWFSENNWSDGTVPGDDLEPISVTLRGSETNVMLNGNVIVSALRILDNATLQITEPDTGDLTVVGPSGLLVRGNLLVDHDRQINVPIGRLTVGEGGVFRAAPQGASRHGDLVTATVNAAEIVIAGSNSTQPGGSVILDQGMLLNCFGDFVIDGSRTNIGTSVGRPTFHMLESASLNIDGDLRLLHAADLQVGDPDSSVPGASGTSTKVFLAGHFDNELVVPPIIGWLTGALTLTPPSQMPRYFEVAGEDRGLCPGGFTENFGMGTIEIVDGASVIFQDAFNNSSGGIPGPATPPEAVYVRNLNLSATANAEADDCVILYENVFGDPGLIDLTNDARVEQLPCPSNAMCDDGNVCTFDQCRCADGTCPPFNPAADYGDIATADPGGVLCGPDGLVTIDDIFAVIDGFQSKFYVYCEPHNIDIAGPIETGQCVSDGVIDILDIFAVIDAFRGMDCCCGGFCPMPEH